MSLTNKLLRNFAARALIIGVAALAAYDVGIHPINPPSACVHQDNGCDDIKKYVLKCLVKDIDKWENSAYECKKHYLPSVTVHGKDHIYL